MRSEWSKIFSSKFRRYVTHPFFDDQTTVEALCGHGNPTLAIVRGTGPLAENIVDFYGEKRAILMNFPSKEEKDVEQDIMAARNGPCILMAKVPYAKKGTDFIITSKKVARSLGLRHVVIDTTIPWTQDEHGSFQLWKRTVPRKSKKTMFKFLKESVPSSYGWSFNNNKQFNDLISKQQEKMEKFSEGRLGVHKGWKLEMRKNLRIIARKISLANEMATFQDEKMSDTKLYMNTVHPYVGEVHPVTVDELVLTSQSFLARVRFFSTKQNLLLDTNTPYIPIAYLPWSRRGGDEEMEAVAHADLRKLTECKAFLQKNMNKWHCHDKGGRLYHYYHDGKEKTIHCDGGITHYLQENILVYRLTTYDRVPLEGVFGPQFVRKSTYSQKMLITGTTKDKGYICQQLSQRHPNYFLSKSTNGDFDSDEEREEEDGDVFAMRSTLLVEDSRSSSNSPPINFQNFDLIIELVDTKNTPSVIASNNNIDDDRVVKIHITDEEGIEIGLSKLEDFLRGIWWLS